MLLECCSTEQNQNNSYRAKEQSRLFIAMIITGVTMFFEFFGGLWTNSLALLSDSAHMFSHPFSLGISYLAIWFAMKTPDESRSYGFYRAEILAALFNGFTLVLIVIGITYDALWRFFHPKPVDILPMLLIAIIGLVVNLATAMTLKSGSEKDLNVKSAFFHTLSDTISSVGIIIAGILIHTTGKVWLDPLASLLIALMIFIWGFGLIKEAIHILLESKPKHLSTEKIVTTIKKEIPEVLDIHHIHIWELASQLCALTAHVAVADITLSQSDRLREKMNGLLKQHFHITHTNLQFECHDPTEIK